VGSIYHTRAAGEAVLQLIIALLAVARCERHPASGARLPVACAEQTLGRGRSSEAESCSGTLMAGCHWKTVCACGHRTRARFDSSRSSSVGMPAVAVMPRRRRHLTTAECVAEESSSVGSSHPRAHVRASCWRLLPRRDRDMPLVRSPAGLR